MKANVKVLIVEDDVAIAELHHKYIQQMEGFEVVGIATSCDEARLQLNLLAPDLVLLDVYLPDGSGLTLLSELRGEKQHCDVILITAARDVDTLQSAMRGGVVDYLLKPVMFPRLSASLEKYSAQRQQINGVQDLDQRLVDQMFQSNSNADSTTVRLPKGIDGVTLDKIRALFEHDQNSFTADEAGEKIGASRTTARRYLEFLITAGDLEADLNYGSVGRPERSYRKLRR